MPGKIQSVQQIKGELLENCRSRSDIELQLYQIKNRIEYLKKTRTFFFAKDREESALEKLQTELNTKKSNLESKFQKDLNTYISHPDFNKELPLYKQYKAVDLDKTKNSSELYYKGMVSLSQALEARKSLTEKLKSLNPETSEALNLQETLREINGFIQTIIEGYLSDQIKSKKE